MHRNTNEYKQKIQTQINMYISKVTMYLFKKAMLKYRLLIIAFEKRLHFFLPFGMFIVTRNLGKFKVKKLDAGNLKAVDDQLEDVD